MRAAYPILLSKGKEYIIVHVPDFDINTQGKDEVDAMEMARDAIGLIGVDMEDENEMLPRPSALGDVRKENESDILTLVDVDFGEYRRKNDMRTVKKNCTIPSWLNFEAEKAGVNFSAILQTALKQELHITDAV
ncbi:MAG: type II toxin-antitoxin system HicB family antitoxin [Clostridiales bacterium]|nr:type II toxin-antitoxin system HicB family antitoxin [Clostridiales bacterium]